MTQYRIVTNGFGEFRIQYWLWPFWFWERDYYGHEIDTTSSIHKFRNFAAAQKFIDEKVRSEMVERAAWKPTQGDK